MAEMHRICTPSPVATVPGVAEYLAEDLRGWRKLAASGQVGPERGGHAGPGSPADPLARLDSWSVRHLDRLAELESRWADAAAGPTLLHSDLRADNMLITDDGVVFVDWPHACTGAPWFDVLAFAPSVAMQGGPDPEWVLGRARSAHGADPDAVTAVVAAVAGYFTRQSLLPSPPGLAAAPDRLALSVSCRSLASSASAGGRREGLRDTPCRIMAWWPYSGRRERRPAPR
jgi:hypothetical protein